MHNQISEVIKLPPLFGVRAISMWIWIDPIQDSFPYDYILDARSPDWATLGDGVGPDQGNFNYKFFAKHTPHTLDRNRGWDRLIMLD